MQAFSQKSAVYTTFFAKSQVNRALFIIYPDAGHQWEMIAVTSQIPRTQVGAIWFFTAIFLIIFEQERQISYSAVIFLMLHRFAQQYLVKASPFSMPTVSGLCPMATPCSGRYINKVVLIEIFQCGRVVIIIEVSCHNDLCPTLKRINGINGFCQLARHLQAIRTGFTLSSPSTGCMHHKHMQRITRDDTSRNIENVSRRTGIRQTLHPPYG